MGDEALPRCHCCGWPTDLERVGVRRDAGRPGAWRIVELCGDAEAGYLHTHQRGFGSEAAAREALANRLIVS